jgi:hypothetical protein
MGQGRTRAHRTERSEMCDPTTWVQVDATALPPDARQSFQSRKLAVELYLRGTHDSEIRRLTGVGEKQAYRLIRNRCMAPAPDGLLFGWRGLIRHLRVRKPARKSKIRIDDFGYGAVGALQATFEAHPDLKLELERRILQVGTNSAKLGAHNRSNVSHTRWFLDKLRKLGYEERGEWPFNTQTLSYSSISRFVKSTLESSARAMAFARGGAEAVKKLKTGDGSRRPELAFMSRVELDAHKLDGFFCVSLPSPDGDVRERIVRRLQVVVLIEVASRTVMGYLLSMGREPPVPI